MTMTQKPILYDDDFKRSAVDMAIRKPKKQVARELGIPESTLRDWCKKYLKEPIFQESLEAEVKRLRQDKADLLQENEILKKSVAIFLKPHR